MPCHKPAEVVYNSHKIAENDKVKEEAQKHNVTDEYELYFLIAHGILHLLGFDHQTEEDYNFVVSEQNKALEYALGEKE